jgi:hypothetical protein
MPWLEVDEMCWLYVAQSSWRTQLGPVLAKLDHQELEQDTERAV